MKKLPFQPTTRELVASLIQRATGSTPTEQPTKHLDCSFTLAEISWGNRILIQVIAQSLGIDEEAWPISAVSAERFGAVWYLSIHTTKPGVLLKSLRYRASAIMINGMYLDHYLEAVALKGI